MRSILLIFALSAGMAAPAAALEIDFTKVLDTAKKIQQATKEINEPREMELGDGIASNLLGAAPLLDNQRAQRYVNIVGRWVAMQTERPDLPWRFGVLDDNDINAFAVPGGSVFITKGLLVRMKNEAELAGVLAHEISHVLRKHHLKAIKKGARADLLGQLAGRALKEGGADDPAFKKLISAGTEVYARGLDKNDEFEADRMGVVIAARSGYDPYGLPAMLQTLHGMNPKDSSLALLFKTHPAFDERLGQLDELMSEPFERFESQPSLSMRFMQAMGKNGNNGEANRTRGR